MKKFLELLESDPEVIIMLAMVVCLFGTIVAAMVCETVVAVSA